MDVFHKEIGLICSIPKITESPPFTISFDALIQTKKIPVRFIGYAAKILRNNFRNGDYIKVSGFMKDGNLLAEYCVLDKRSSTGRNVSVYG